MISVQVWPWVSFSLQILIQDIQMGHHTVHFNLVLISVVCEIIVGEFYVWMNILKYLLTVVLFSERGNTVIYLREEHRTKVFENNNIRWIFSSGRVGLINGESSKLYLLTTRFISITKRVKIIKVARNIKSVFGKPVRKWPL